MNTKPTNFPEFSWGSVATFSLAIAATILIAGAFTPTIYGFCLLAIVFSLSKRVEYTLLLFMLMFGLNVANFAIFPKTAAFITAERVTVFIVATGVVAASLREAKKQPHVMSPFIFLFVYLLYMAAVSFFGWHPPISELKLLLFFVLVFALVNLCSIANKSNVDLRPLRAGVLSFALLYIVGSLLAWRFPWSSMSATEAARFDLGSALYRGTTWHSQTLGALCAMLNAVLLADYLSSLKKRNWLYLIVFATAPLLIYKSSSRTAMLTYLASVAACFIFILLSKSISTEKKRKVGLLTMGIGLIAICIFFMAPQASHYTEQFLRKESADVADYKGEWSDKLLSSRQGLMENAMNHFHDSPWIGNGFQVSKEMENQSLSILSAPVEKGFMPTMILEEGGAIGGLLFVFFLLAIYIKYMQINFVCFLTSFTAFLIANCGEATIFSITNTGGISWILCFCALIIDVQREKARLLAMPHS